MLFSLEDSVCKGELRTEHYGGYNKWVLDRENESKPRLYLIEEQKLQEFDVEEFPGRVGGIIRLKYDVMDGIEGRAEDLTTNYSLATIHDNVLILSITWTLNLSCATRILSWTSMM